MKKGLITLSLSATLLVIGIHQSMVNGITESYWIFMFAVGFLLLHQYLKKKDEEASPEAGKDKGPVKLEGKERGIEGEGKLARKMRRRQSRAK